MSLQHRQTGATMTELLVAIPLVLLLGMIGVQYGLLYNAKNNVTYASYEAARAGAINNADPEAISDGLLKGMLPFLSSSTPKGDLTAMLSELKGKESAFMKVEIISPSKEAFDDFSNAELQKLLGTTNRVIPNKYIDTIKQDRIVGKKSGITIHEANVLKLRITYGYKPTLPLAKNMFVSVASFIDSSQDSFAKSLFLNDRIPISVDVSAQMLSPAVENGLKTVAYTPPKGNTPIGPNINLPDLKDIKLPDGYESMTADEIIAVLETDPTNKRKSKKELLALLVALGIVGAGIYDGMQTDGVTGDLMMPQVCN